MSETNSGQDFIVSELLSELKESNVRKDQQIKELHSIVVKLVVGALMAVLLTIAGFLVYLNQYDFSSTSTVTQSAEGVYALVDSEGNSLALDLTPEQVEAILEAVDNG